MVLAKNAAPGLKAKIEDGTYSQAELTEEKQVTEAKPSEVTTSKDVAPKRRRKSKETK